MKSETPFGSDKLIKLWIKQTCIASRRAHLGACLLQIRIIGTEISKLTFLCVKQCLSILTVKPWRDTSQTVLVDGRVPGVYKLSLKKKKDFGSFASATLAPVEPSRFLP